MKNLRNYVCLISLLFSGLSWAGDGIMVFKTSPKDVKVYVDNEFKGEANGLVLSLQEGKHQVEIKKGKQSRKKSYFVPGDGIVKVTLALDNPVASTGKAGFKSVSSSYGYIKVLSKPSGMEIYLNDKYAGTTPAKRIKVDSGEYKLVIKDPNRIYTPYKKSLSIEKFGLETVDAPLSKGVATIFFIGEQAGSYCGQKVPGPVKIFAGKNTVGIQGASGGYQQGFNLKAGQEVEAEYSLRSSVGEGSSTCPNIDFHTGMEFIAIQSGCFQMGSESGSSNEKPVHKVCINKVYNMGKYEVTQAQWQKVMGHNPSKFKNCGDSCPVERVSWEDVQQFIQKLKQQTGLNYRLPTEAEWEYACRGGEQHKYCGSHDVNRVGWYDDNSGDSTHPVGQKAANGYGLYDMSGNVWEWVNDWYDSDYYRNSPTNDPKGASSGRARVYRGGSWINGARSLRSACRSAASLGYRYYDLGFRLVRQP